MIFLASYTYLALDLAMGPKSLNSMREGRGTLCLSSRCVLFNVAAMSYMWLLTT